MAFVLVSLVEGIGVEIHPHINLKVDRGQINFFLMEDLTFTLSLSRIQYTSGIRMELAPQPWNRDRGGVVFIIDWIMVAIDGEPLLQTQAIYGDINLLS
jgi:hypothetical protein